MPGVQSGMTSWESSRGEGQGRKRVLAFLWVPHTGLDDSLSGSVHGYALQPKVCFEALVLPENQSLVISVRERQRPRRYRPDHNALDPEVLVEQIDSNPALFGFGIDSARVPDRSDETVRV